jgi:hypothetical protein
VCVKIGAAQTPDIRSDDAAKSLEFYFMFSDTYQRTGARSAGEAESAAMIWNTICSSFPGKGGDDMSGVIQIVSGLVLGCAGFHQIAEHPIQGISALFLAGFLVMIGFEKKLAERSREIRN